MTEPYYIAWKYDHQISGPASPIKPSIAISTLSVGRLVPPLKVVVYHDRGERDRDFDRLTTPQLINEFAVEHGLPPAPVETFLDFGGFAFDARDVLAISIEQPIRFAGEPQGHPWIKCYFRGDRGERFFHAPFHDGASLREGYARIVTAMKASRS